MRTWTFDVVVNIHMISQIELFQLPSMFLPWKSLTLYIHIKSFFIFSNIFCKIQWEFHMVEYIKKIQFTCRNKPLARKSSEMVDLKLIKRVKCALHVLYPPWETLFFHAFPIIQGLPHSLTILLNALRETPLERMEKPTLFSSNWILLAHTSTLCPQHKWACHQ